MNETEITPRRPTGADGFTLIEIMVVIAIIGMIAYFVAPGVMERFREAKVTATQVKITNLKQAVDTYRRHYAKAPDSLQELLEPNDKNLGEPYLPEQEYILDAWGNEFRYSKLSSNKYEILSLGADGMEGGEFDDADISSLKEKMVGG